MGMEASVLVRLRLTIGQGIWILGSGGQLKGKKGRMDHGFSALIEGRWIMDGA